MKTTGERIRQAREARKMSGQQLAIAVGYKTQSAIGNLENRARGTGGGKIGQIAQALSVPVEWLLNGPDSDSVPSARAYSDLSTLTVEGRASGLPPLLQEGLDLLRSMSPSGREQALTYLRFMATQHAATDLSNDGERDSIPRKKA